MNCPVGLIPVGAHIMSRPSRHLSPIPTASPLQNFFRPSLFFWETPLPFLWTRTIFPHMRLENRHPDVLAGSTLHRRLVRTANGRGISDGANPGRCSLSGTSPPQTGPAELPRSAVPGSGCAPRIFRSCAVPPPPRLIRKLTSLTNSTSCLADGLVDRPARSRFAKGPPHAAPPRFAMDWFLGP